MSAPSELSHQPLDTIAAVGFILGVAIVFGLFMWCLTCYDKEEENKKKQTPLLNPSLVAVTYGKTSVN